MSNETDNKQIVFSSDAWLYRGYLSTLTKTQASKLSLNDDRLSLVNTQGEIYYNLSIEDIELVKFGAGNWFEITTKAGKVYRTVLYDPSYLGYDWLLHKANEGATTIADQWISILKQYVTVSDQNRGNMKKYLIWGYVGGGIISVTLAVSVFIYIFMRQH